MAAIGIIRTQLMVISYSSVVDRQLLNTKHPAGSDWGIFIISKKYQKKEKKKNDRKRSKDKQVILCFALSQPVQLNQGEQLQQ